MAIKAFSHKGLEELFCQGKTAKVGARYHEKAKIVLDAIAGATGPQDLVGALGFHQLKGKRKRDYAMSVSGNMRITFRFEDGHVTGVDFEDYH